MSLSTLFNRHRERSRGDIQATILSRPLLQETATATATSTTTTSTFPQPVQQSTFVYPSRPLNPSKREIRVLRLRPGKYGSAMSCDLEIVSLQQYKWNSLDLDDYIPHDVRGPGGRRVRHASKEDYLEAAKQHKLPSRTCRSICRLTRVWHPTHVKAVSLQIPTCGVRKCQCYQAISYTWGASDEAKTIKLHEQSGFAVTDNLFRALQRLRHSKRDRVLWIDAICINQGDLEERALQVSIMTEIYRTCYNLIIWLGDSTVIPPSAQSNTLKPVLLLDRKSLRQDLRRKALKDTLTKTKPMWWERMWVLPEVIAFGFAPEPDVVIGSVFMTWSCLLDTMSGMEELDAVREGLSPLRGLENHSFLGLRRSTASRVCRDPRDKIFSLLGVVRSASIKVSYSPAYTKEMVFADATRAAASAEGFTETFRHVNCTLPRDKDLPSWAINFGAQQPHVIDLIPSGSGTTGNAIFDFGWWLPRIPSLPWSKLHLRGLELDRIRKCMPLDSGIVQHTPPTAPRMIRIGRDISRQLPTHFPYCNLMRANCGGLDRPQCLSGCRGERSEHAYHLNFQVELDRLGPEQLGIESTRMMRTMDLAHAVFKAWQTTWRLGGSHYHVCQFPAQDHSFFITEAGFIGMAQNGVQSGDAIVIFNRYDLPAILSPDPEHSAEYTFRGLAGMCGPTKLDLEVHAPGLELPKKDFVVR